MKKNYNGKTRLRECGPIWKVKIGIHTALTENSIKAFEKAKKLKLKVILN